MNKHAVSTVHGLAAQLGTAGIHGGHGQKGCVSRLRKRPPKVSPRLNLPGHQAPLTSACGPRQPLGEHHVARGTQCCQDPAPLGSAPQALPSVSEITHRSFPRAAVEGAAQRAGEGSGQPRRCCLVWKPVQRQMALGVPRAPSRSPGSICSPGGKPSARVRTADTCAISISRWLSPSSSRYLHTQARLSRHGGHCGGHHGHPHPPLVAGQTTDHGFRLLRVSKSDQEGGSLGTKTP